MITADLGKRLAIGRTAEIYTWGDGQVLKLFFDWFDLENIQFEQSMVQAVHAAGLPVPAAGEVLRINGHNGLIYERVVGRNIWEVLEKRPWRLFDLAHHTAQLHADMHTNPLHLDLPPQHRRLERRIGATDSLPAPLKQACLEALSTLPDGDSICHGDFHPGNILFSSGHFVIIDWIDTSRGNPLADVARTTILTLGAAASSQVPITTLKVLIRLFHSVYLGRYFQLRPGGIAEYRRWLPVVAAARLSENIPELECWLVQQAGKVL
jgi:Ser/Thr protein kinase RdoA (MazF antagonist)